MPLINDADSVREIIQGFRERTVSVATFCSKNHDCTTALMIAAQRAAEELEIPALPLFVAATGRYEHRQQLVNYTPLGDALEGFRAFRDDVLRLGRQGGPFDRVIPMPFLDHAQPGKDDDLLDVDPAFWAGVMYDASEFPLEENVLMTKQFVQRRRADYFIEGICDQVACFEEPDRVLDEPTTPEQANLYLEQTGVDALVVNLGTEHRSMGKKRQYLADRARMIRDVIGQRMVIHGTSCISPAEMNSLPADGILKVNIWTALEVASGRAIARDTLQNLCGILPHESISESLPPWLRPAEQLPSQNPELDLTVHKHRRDDVFVPSVCRLVLDYLTRLGYGRLAGWSVAQGKQ